MSIRIIKLVSLEALGILLAILSVSSCAPMPGPELMEGLTHPTPLEDVHVTKTVGVWGDYMFL